MPHICDEFVDRLWEYILTYLADDGATKADNHSPADDFGLHDKVPRFVEQFAEAREVQYSVLLRADA